MASSLDYPQEIETPCQMTARRDIGNIQRKPFGIRIGRECSSEQKSRENCFSRGKRQKEQ